jgi:hypothetical protein
MSNSSNSIRVRAPRARLKCLAALASIALLCSAAVFSGVDQPAKPKAPSEARGNEARRKPGALNLGYQVRCWQHGRLVLEENNLEAPTESPAYAISFNALDRNRTPLYLVDIKSGLCLIKNTEFEPNRAPVAEQ